MKVRRPRTLIGYLLLLYAIIVIVAVIAYVNHFKSVLGLGQKEEYAEETYEIAETQESEEDLDLDKVLQNFENNVINTNIDNVTIVKEYECTNGDTVYRIENNSDERVYAKNIKLCYYSLETKGYFEVPTYPMKVYIPANSYSYIYVFDEKGSVKEGYTLEKCKLEDLNESNFLVDVVELSNIKRDDIDGILISTLTNKRDGPLTGTEIMVVFFKGETPVGVTYGLTKTKLKGGGYSKLFIPYPTDYETETVIEDFDSYKAFCLYSTY